MSAVYMRSLLNIYHQIRNNLEILYKAEINMAKDRRIKTVSKCSMRIRNAITYYYYKMPRPWNQYKSSADFVQSRQVK